MQRYESQQVQINRPAEVIYTLLSNFNNLTPALAGQVEGWSATEESCVFKVKGIPIGLRMVEREAPKLIKVSSETGSPTEFTIWFQMAPVAPSQTRMRIVADVKLNVMMKMMLGKKLESGINHLAEQIATSFNNAPM